MIEWIITSTVLIIIICILRITLKGKISHRVRYAMWMIVAVRLMVPFSVGESSLSIMNVAQFIPDMHNKSFESMSDNLDITQPGISFEVAEEGRSVQSGFLENTITTKSTGTFGKQEVLEDLDERLDKYKEYLPTPLYRSGVVVSPCLFGLIKPAVYVSSVPESDEQLRHILTHKYTHYCHLDHIWSFVRLLCICVHWYNPFVWIAAGLSRKDCELACDEGAIKRLGEENRIAYGDTLISMIAVGNGITGVMCGATTMVGSKKSIQERIVFVAKKTIHSKVALACLVVVVVIAVGCTYTGQKLSLSEGEVKKLILEESEYEENQIFDFYKADYNKDEHEDAFVLVYVMTEDATRKELEKYYADIWYFDGLSKECSMYEDRELVVYSNEHIRVLELADKIFMAYDKEFSEEYHSQLLGIREGEVINYLKEVVGSGEYDLSEIHSWTPTGEQNYKGEIKSVDGNDIVVNGYALDILTDGTFDADTDRQKMSRYLYYDKETDKLTSYKAYALCEDDILKFDNGAETIEHIYNLYEDAYVYFDFAKRNDMLHIMAEVVSDVESLYECFTYRLTDESIGELVMHESGKYEDIDEKSTRAVISAYQEDFYAKQKLYNELIDEYASSVIKDKIISSRYIDIGVGKNQDGVRIYYYMLDEEMNSWVNVIEYIVKKTDGRYQVISSESFSYGDGMIDSREVFIQAYGHTLEFKDEVIICPAFFELGLTDDIIRLGISDYNKPDTAAIRFFNLNGGTVSNMTENHDGSYNLIYIFADNSEIELQMYKTYDGVWLPVWGGYLSNAKQINDWYKSLTEEDFVQSILPWQISEYDWIEHEKRPGIVLCEEFSEIGVNVYFSMAGNCMILERNGKRSVFSKIHDTFRGGAPQVSLSDYDDDGEDELLLICQTGHGTGVSYSDVAVIDSVYGQFDTMNVFDTPALVINEMLTGEYDGESLLISIGEEEHQQLSIEIKTALEKDEDEYRRILTGDWICFEMDENKNVYVDLPIYVQTKYITWLETIGGLYPGEGMCPWPDCIRADVQYHSDGTFTLGNLRFVKKW